MEDTAKGRKEKSLETWLLQQSLLWWYIC